MDTVDPADVMRFARLCQMSRMSPRGCWHWRGHKDRKGYGQFWLRGRAHWAHRVSYVAFVGPIPDGKQIDHACGNPSCVNPAHLEVVSLAENRRRQHEARQAANA